jgi:hypothetical protein
MIDPSSLTATDRSRKYVQLVLQAMQEPGRQVAAATAMGMSESTISRLKNEHLAHFALLLAHIGLKVVPTDRVCVSRETYLAMSHIASKAMANERMARELVWDDDDA